jgi:hypothetical protein
MALGGLYQMQTMQSRDMHILFSSTGGPSGNSNSGGNGGNSGNNQPQGGDSHVAGASGSKKEEEVKVNRYIDQTVLKGGTTWEEVKKVC